MSRPSSSTSPSTRAVGTVSCMRLRQRRKVDLPHPDGPIIAVTWRSRTCMLTRFTACTLPNHAFSEATRMRGRATSAAGVALTSETSSVATMVRSVATPCREASARCDARDETNDEDERDEDERSCPSEGMPCVIGADRVREDLQRKRGDWLPQRQTPELVAKCGEEQRSRFARDAGDGHERARHDPGARRTQYDRERSAPARIAECERGLAQRDRYDPDHFL